MRSKVAPIKEVAKMTRTHREGVVAAHGRRVWAKGNLNEGATIFFSDPSLDISIKKEANDELTRHALFPRSG
jgi:hypothetical protein